ncbi:hypothetical protein [Lentzea sp.]|uniref:hypothetical protein n=1 Tax=Lentzea sp. TaxID=56099 RepID=UPI002ED1E9AE
MNDHTVGVEQILLLMNPGTRRPAPLAEQALFVVRALGDQVVRSPFVAEPSERRVDAPVPRAACWRALVNSAGAALRDRGALSTVERQLGSSCHNGCGAARRRRHPQSLVDDLVARTREET